MDETMRPLSFGMLLPCLKTQYLLRKNDAEASISDILKPPLVTDTEFASLPV